MIQRFKTNDRVFILPKYAHLYPQNSAVIIRALADPYRPMFNEYTLQFPDQTNAKVFEFQVIEELQNYNTVIAQIVIDSQRRPIMADIRGENIPTRQVVLQTPRFDIDMEISKSTPLASIMGQVLDKGGKGVLKNLDVRLMRESTSLSSVLSDSVGVFKFGHVPHGSLNILVTIHQDLCRILGAFSI